MAIFDGGKHQFTFVLAGKELESARAWQRDHPCRPAGPLDDDFRSFAFEFNPSGVGTSIVVKCCHCGKKENVTDYDCW